MGELSQKLTPKEQHPGNSQAHGPCNSSRYRDIVYLESGLPKRSKPTEGENRLRQAAKLSGHATDGDTTLGNDASGLCPIITRVE
jgi:hypothetical protein